MRYVTNSFLYTTHHHLYNTHCIYVYNTCTSSYMYHVSIGVLLFILYTHPIPLYLYTTDLTRHYVCLEGFQGFMNQHSRVLWEVCGYVCILTTLSILVMVHYNMCTIIIYPHSNISMSFVMLNLLNIHDCISFVYVYLNMCICICVCVLCIACIYPLLLVCDICTANVMKHNSLCVVLYM